MTTELAESSVPPDRPKGVRHGGRQKGTPNHTTAAIRALASEEGPANIAMLAAFRDDVANPAAVRIEAIKVLLDRGFGRPSQEVRLQMDVNVSVYAGLSDAELADRAEALARQLRGDTSHQLPPAPEGTLDAELVGDR